MLKRGSRSTSVRDQIVSRTGIRVKNVSHFFVSLYHELHSADGIFGHPSIQKTGDRSVADSYRSQPPCGLHADFVGMLTLSSTISTVMGYSKGKPLFVTTDCPTHSETTPEQDRHLTSDS
ncbi:hypothetical protein EVAR_96745_1 [Eumeta japonica]|uniref:Uncharacterized protein n=1 Tax=Eumeta variegata TaxID=151549 RepID=A0A4C1XYY9_EUMVA|nr:hypothetical protein EVAR_96745_1 [Eumeta japonica]